MSAGDGLSGFLVRIFRNVTAVVFDTREARRHLLEHLIGAEP
jgi:hypothetical protein